MGQAVLPGNPPVEITLRRSARARRVSLRVSALDGRVTLSMPHYMDEAEALNFAREKSGWIRGHLAKQHAPVDVGLGATVMVRGQEVAVTGAQVRRVSLQDGALLVPDNAGMAAARVKAWLRLDAKTRLAEAVDRYAALAGRKVGRVTLRDTRSRWGSCTATGNLNFSWRLAMAPPEALDYVAAHEVAHLVEMNHSPAYWRVVARICPDYEAPRRWLKTQGHRLHRYRFGD
ncbi:M48 family metallopeptidase [Psychromarinibacter sp. S121]|uniref:M48 family metallopeptidase n=1 Tax=Psychromarinibacter sp. S121 TaxID=3415127 RepID=UPI003C7E3D1D